MATKAFKAEKIEAIKENIAKAKVTVVTEYRGLSVDNVMNLRRALQKENCDYQIAKNTLAKLAIKGTEHEVLADILKGPVALAYGFEDQVAPAKILAKFFKEFKKGEIIAASMDGQLLDKADAKALASLPSKEELYAKMLGSINSPASGIVCSVNAVMSGLVRAIDAVAKQKAA